MNVTFHLPAPHRRRQATAFILIEIMLALALFGMSAVGLIKALARTSQLAAESQMDVRMLLRLQSRLTEISKLTDITPWKDKSETSPRDELGVWTETSVEEMKDFKNEDGQELTQMYRIYVKAFYTVEWQKDPIMMDAEVWRFAPLYRTNSSAAAPTAAPPP